MLFGTSFAYSRFLRFRLGWGHDATVAPAKKKPPVQEQQARGLKYLRQINKLLHRLHADATKRDRAGNRTLFYDQYATLVLIAMFSPAIDSLRAIQHMPKVRKLLGCPSRASLGLPLRGRTGV